MSAALAVTLTVLVSGTTVFAGVFLWAYGAGNAWYVGRIGRALVGQGTGIALILGYASLKRLFGWPTIPWIQVVLYLIVFLIELGMAVAFLRERREMRRRQSAVKDHRIERIEP